MRSPIVAMLWENWRLTRIEAALRLGQGIVLGSAAMLLFDAGATIAFWIILCTNAFIWFSIAKLNGGRFMDGYKPGFPFYLLYSRPVPTVVFVGVTMGYDALSGVVLYLVSAALVGFAFGQPLPLFSVIPWIVASRLGYTCIQWSTPNRIVQWVGSLVVYAPLFILLQQRVGSPPQVELSHHRERSDDPGWRRVVRSHGRRRSAAAPRRFRRGRAPVRSDRADTRNGWFPCSGSRVPLRQRRGRRCGSSSSPADCPYWRLAWRWR